MLVKTSLNVSVKELHNDDHNLFLVTPPVSALPYFLSIQKETQEPH